jgi:hypothetical protein
MNLGSYRRASPEFHFGFEPAPSRHGGMRRTLKEVTMPEPAGPSLDLEIARRVFGEQPVRVPAYSTDNVAADLLLWRIAQAGVAFKIQEIDGRHYCMLWHGSGGSDRRLTTVSSESRPLAIGRAALDHFANGPLRAPRKLEGEGSPSRARF